MTLKKTAIQKQTAMIRFDEMLAASHFSSRTEKCELHRGSFMLSIERSFPRPLRHENVRAENVRPKKSYFARFCLRVPVVGSESFWSSFLQTPRIGSGLLVILSDVT